MSDSQSVLLVSVGNTRTRFAVALGNGSAMVAGGAGSQLEPSRVHENTSIPDLAHAISNEADKAGASVILLASVNNPVADQLAAALHDTGQLTVRRFGSDIPIPIPHTLSDPGGVGQDRLLNALGAFARSEQACIVIDAGTAVTIDFVDGEGTFHGGAISPGLRMMCDALHERTAALPRVEVAAALLHNTPGEPPFGKNTAEAIALGVTASIVGLTHLLIDRYAAFYEAYPRIVATGGDAPFLFEEDPLVEHIVPDLTLIGMLAAWEMGPDATAE